MSPPPILPAPDSGAENAADDLGLPSRGPGSIATLLRRALAAVVDWLLSQLIVVGVLGIPLDGGGSAAFAPLGVFALMHLLLVGTLGTTIGHRVAGIGVQALDGAAPRPLQALIRTFMVVLFFPAIFTAADGRGFHDKAAQTVTVRTR